MIESFNSNEYVNILRDLYYNSLLEHNIDYKYDTYIKDFVVAASYFPFFVAIWFGTIDEEKLIDKEFPKKYIKRLFNFYNFIYEDSNLVEILL